MKIKCYHNPSLPSSTRTLDFLVTPADLYFNLSLCIKSLLHCSSPEPSQATHTPHTTCPKNVKCKPVNHKPLLPSSTRNLGILTTPANYSFDLSLHSKSLLDTVCSDIAAGRYCLVEESCSCADHHRSCHRRIFRASRTNGLNHYLVITATSADLCLDLSPCTKCLPGIICYACCRSHIAEDRILVLDHHRSF